MKAAGSRTGGRKKGSVSPPDGRSGPAARALTSGPSTSVSLPPAFFAALRSFPTAQRYLVGVSGGRDSVALLQGLFAAGYQRLVVCHLDHGLRGPSSRADARFVMKLAQEMSLPLEAGSVNVRAFARAHQLSLETAAREARYQFLAAAAGRRRCRTVFLAHQADDQAETFLFNLLRGAGPAGLSGMKIDSARPVKRSTLRIVRPLLGVWRAEIDAYLLGRGLTWREDRTNADPAHATRNALRHEAIPMLARLMGRDVRRALWRTADIIGAEETWISTHLMAEGGLAAEPSAASLGAQPVALQRRLLRSWLAARGVAGIGYEEIERVRTLIDASANGPAKINLPGDRHARRRGGQLFVE